MSEEKVNTNVSAAGSPDESFIFYNLIEKSLAINIETFEKNERLEAFERLINASNAMQGKVGDFTGINICIHVASSFVLLGCTDSKKYRTTEGLLKEKRFNRVDPSVILTSSALYYILQKLLGRLNDENQYLYIEQNYIEYLKKKAENENRKFVNGDLKKAQKDMKQVTSKMEYINTRFGLMNWMIGVDVMKILGIPNWKFDAKDQIWVMQEQEV